jgi:hypothetical protein
MIRYSLEDFNNILNTGLINQLPDETIQIINMLATQVGAPEYIKTPQFKNKIGASMVGGVNNGGNNNGIRRKKKYPEINDNDWEAIRSFQTTEFNKKEGIYTHIHAIRKYLNMITINTYLKLKESIIEEINIVISTKTPNDLNVLCNELFNIVNSNILYSDIYAQLYKDLITQFAVFKDILMKNFSQLENNFNNIEYYDPEVDYDKFCENNKKNELLRSNCSFYVNLMKEGIIEVTAISNIITNLFNILQQQISEKTKKNELDELAEIIYIFITNSYELIKKNDEQISKNIYDNVLRITNTKIKDEPGITNKCIFKHMDILDEISQYEN